MMAPTNPHGMRNRKHPRQEETPDQLPMPKRSANSCQPSRQRSQSMTIQDDDVIEATPPPLPAGELQTRLDANEARLDSFVRKVETKFKQQGHQLEEILNHLTSQQGQNNGTDEDDDDAQRGNGNVALKSPLQFVKKAFPWLSESILRDIAELKLTV